MNYFLGAELNGSRLKISAFKKNGQVLELIKLESLNLPNEASEATKELTNWINRSLTEPTSVKAVLTVSESTLYIKELEFPKMPQEKINEAIYWEIPSIAPVPQSDAVYDWQITSNTKDGSKILVIVGKNSSIQNLILTFRNAQIDVVAIEPSSHAFARIANAPFDTNTLVCLVEEQGTDFIILKNGMPYFTTSTTGSTQSEVVSQIKSGTDLTTGIAVEGKKIINFWEGKESLKIHQVVLAGDLIYKYFGTSASLNLFPPVTTYIGTNKKIKNLKIASFNDSEILSYLISIGAGIRHLQKDVLEGINLFPPVEKQKAEKIRIQKKIAGNLMNYIYANLIVIILLIISFIVLNIWWFSLEKQLEKLSASIANRPTAVLSKDAVHTNSVIKNVISLTKSQDDTGVKLNTISNSTPQNIKLTAINMTDTNLQEWKIEGIGDRDSILAFHKKLSEEIKATDVSMEYSNFNQATENEFTILLKW